MATTGIDEEFNIDLTTIWKLKDCIPVYHPEQDTFFVRPVKPIAATSFDFGGELWLRLNPETGEIVGIEIENFESVFLKKYPALAKIWKDAKPHCVRRKIRTRDDESMCESFISIMIDLLSGFFKDKPQQAQLGLA
jgi:hypothetical protein